MLSSVAAVRYRIVFQFCRSEYYFEMFFSGSLYFFCSYSGSNRNGNRSAWAVRDIVVINESSYIVIRYLCYSLTIACKYISPLWSNYYIRPADLNLTLLNNFR